MISRFAFAGGECSGRDGDGGPFRTPSDLTEGFWRTGVRRCRAPTDLTDCPRWTTVRARRHLLCPIRRRQSRPMHRFDKRALSRQRPGSGLCVGPSISRPPRIAGGDTLVIAPGEYRMGYCASGADMTIPGSATCRRFRMVPFRPIPPASWGMDGRLAVPIRPNHGELRDRGAFSI